MIWKPIVSVMPKMTDRTTRWVIGNLRKSQRSRRVKRWSGFGSTQGGVRWKSSRRPTFSTICGTTWIALAPVPMTATRFPVRSTSWSHSAVWKAGPAKESRPSISGSEGWFSPPIPPTATRAV